MNPYSHHVCNYVLYLNSNHFFRCCPIYSTFCVIPLITLIACFHFPREILWERLAENWNKAASLKCQYGADVLVPPAASHCPGSSLSLKKQGNSQINISGAFNIIEHQPSLGLVQINPNSEKHSLSWNRQKVFRQKQCRKSSCSIPVKIINIDSDFLLVTSCFVTLLQWEFHCTRSCHCLTTERKKVELLFFLMKRIYNKKK